MTRNRRAVIFDMDGVLTDSEPLINAAAVAMFREKGLTVQPEDFLPFVGTGEDRYIGGVAEKYQFPLDLLAAKRRTYELYLALVPGRLEAFAGSGDLVQACRQAGLLVAVASSADRIKIDANLRKIGLPPEGWNAIVSGEEVLRKKPAPDIFLAAATKLGMTPADCVVVEDAVNGVQAAKAAGMRCVAVAQTFAAEQLGEADLVRQKICEVGLQDLIGPTQADSIQRPDSCRPRPTIEPGRPWGFWISAGLALATGAIAALAQIVVVFFWALGNAAMGQHLSPSEAGTNGLLLALVTIAATPVILATVWFFVWLRKGTRPADYLALRPVSGRTLLRWTLVLVALVCAWDGLTVWLGRDPTPEFMHKVYQTAGFRPLLWVALVFAGPISEELVFRGFWFKGLLHSRLGALGAILVTSSTWASIHYQYNLYEIGTVFGIGLLLGYARWKTQSLYPPLFLHGLMNLIATLEIAWN
jgi:HAD superfamily hydrolase (TIGR01509 family)